MTLLLVLTNRPVSAEIVHLMSVSTDTLASLLCSDKVADKILQHVLPVFLFIMIVVLETEKFTADVRSSYFQIFVTMFYNIHSHQVAPKFISCLKSLAEVAESKFANEKMVAEPLQKSLRSAISSLLESTSLDMYVFFDINFF